MLRARKTFIWSIGSNSRKVKSIKIVYHCIYVVEMTEEVLLNLKFIKFNKYNWQ